MQQPRYKTQLPENASRKHVPSPPAISLTNLFTVAFGSATSSAVQLMSRSRTTTQARQTREGTASVSTPPKEQWEHGSHTPRQKESKKETGKQAVPAPRQSSRLPLRGFVPQPPPLALPSSIATPSKKRASAGAQVSYRNQPPVFRPATGELATGAAMRRPAG